MPIDIKCSNCAAAFRAPDKFAGKRVKCPKCQGTIAVPAAVEKGPVPQKATVPKKAAKAGSTAQPSKQQKAPEKPKPAAAKKPAAPAKPAAPTKQAADQWFVQTDDSEQYGPVSKDELHDWIAEGRLDASCQVLCEGWEQWKWAEEIFDELGKTHEPAAEENPFAGLSDVTPPVETVNPFESPRTSASPAVTDSESSKGGITPVMRQALAQTRPWVLFLSILGFIGGGFGVLMCFGVLVLAVLAMAQVGAGAILLAVMALVGGSAFALYVYAAYCLFSYASQIARFLQDNQPQALERAMLAQKSFWKLVGMVTAIVLGLETLLFLISLLAGGLAMSA